MSRPNLEEPLAGKKLLPPGWRWARLFEVCIQDKKIVDVNIDATRRIPYLGLEDIESVSGKIKKRDIEKSETVGMSTTFAFDRGHVLYGKLRPYLNKVGLPDSPGRCTTEIIPLIPKDGINRVYLAWLLRREETVHEAMRGKTGSRMPRADMNELLKVAVPVAPSYEQERIAGILNERMAAIDKARAAAEARLEAAKALQFGYVKESLLNSTTTSVSLRECLIEVTKGVGQTWGNFIVFGATRNGLALAKEPPGKHPERYKYVCEGTIFYNPMRILLGSIAHVDANVATGITSPDYVVFKTKSGILHHRWFYHWLRSPLGDKLIRSLVRGAVRERMLFNRLNKGLIDLPSWEAQTIAAEKIAMVKPIIKPIKTQMDEINALPQALLRQAFNGEL